LETESLPNGLASILAERAGFGPTYTVVAIFMLFVAGIMWWLGPDTGVKAAATRAVVRSA